MPWTSPRTWTTGELITAAICNTHIRDNLNYLGTSHAHAGSAGDGARIQRNLSVFPSTVLGTGSVSNYGTVYPAVSLPTGATRGDALFMFDVPGSYGTTVKAVVVYMSTATGTVARNLRAYMAGSGSGGTSKDSGTLTSSANYGTALIVTEDDVSSAFGSMTANDHVGFRWSRVPGAPDSLNGELLVLGLNLVWS